MTVADDVIIYAVLLTLLKPQESTAADATNKHLPSRDLHVDVTVSPSAPQLMFVGTQLTVSVVVTSADNSTCDSQRPACDGSALMMSVSSHRPMSVVAMTARSPLRPDPANDTITHLHFRLNQSVDLVVHARSVGRAVLTFEISTASVDLDTDNKKIETTNVDNWVDIRYAAVHRDIESSKSGISTHSANADGSLVRESSPSHLLAVIEYHITVARRRRQIDDGFFWAVAAATLLNAFGLGCVTVYNDVIKELRKLQPYVLATLLCQFVIIPPVC